MASETTEHGVGRVLIVIPGWNEEESIGAVIHEVRDTLPFVDVLVVNDGSTDRTAEVAAEAGATVLTLPYNLGVGGALRLGYRYAYEQDYDVAIQVDADGQHDPVCVPKLLDALSDNALVIGARFAGEGAYKAHGPRQWAMSMLSFVISRIAHTKLTDTTSGFKACNRELIELFAEWFPAEYLGDTIEVLVRVIRLGYPVAQVPVSMRARQGGTPSHSPLKAAVYLVRAFFILFLALIRR